MRGLIARLTRADSRLRRQYVRTTSAHVVSGLRPQCGRAIGAAVSSKRR